MIQDEQPWEKDEQPWEQDEQPWEKDEQPWETFMGGMMAEYSQIL